MSNNKKEKILIIENNVALGERIAKILKEDGYVTFLVNDGAEGLKSIYDILPHLIIMDLTITGEMDAYTVLEKKHSDVMLSKIPVFLLSNDGNPINMRRVPEGSVADFIATLELDPLNILNRVNIYFKHAEAPVKEVENDEKKKKIFWIEDDKLIGSILEKKFIASKFELVHVVNGEEALARLKVFTPDIIVTDLMLPGIDGFEILQKIRMEERFKKTPVMILSNLSKPSDFEKAKLLGASKYLVKAASSLDQIVSEVRGMLEK